MSEEDSTSKKPKLRLSKRYDATKEAASTTDPEPIKFEEATKETPKKTYKLSKSEEAPKEETPPPQPQSAESKPPMQLNSPKGAAPPSEPFSTKPSSQSMEAPKISEPSKTSEASEAPKPPTSQPKIPKQAPGKSEKQQITLDREGITASKTRPSIPAKNTTPSVEHEFAAATESLVKADSTGSNHLVSVLSILALFLILGAASYGIYIILSAPPEKSVAVPAPESKTPPTPKPEVKSTSAPEPEPEPAPVPVVTEKATPVSAPTPPTTAVNDYTQNVTDYLSQVHIGGMRTGPDPRVMLNNVTYREGDTVAPETGLKFIGVDNQRLVFQDANGVLYKKSF